MGRLRCHLLCLVQELKLKNYHFVGWIRNSWFVVGLLGQIRSGLLGVLIVSMRHSSAKFQCLLKVKVRNMVWFRVRCWTNCILFKILNLFKTFQYILLVFYVCLYSGSSTWMKIVIMKSLRPTNVRKWYRWQHKEFSDKTHLMVV